jgi:glycosyltransferase involved in cell wall biosynthesis
MAAPHVMFVNGSLFGGGAEHVIATLARHLRDTGHRITIAVIHRGGEVQTELMRDGFDVVTQVAERAGRGSTSARLRHLVEERGVDIVHSHDLRSLVDAGICRLRTGQVAHMHTFHFGNYPFVPWKHLLMEGMFARVPDQLVAVGNVQRESIIKALRVPAGRIRTIWNGVDYVSRPVWTGSETSHAGPRIGSVSTLGEQKGLPTLLQAAKILQDRGLAFRLVLVGDGPMRGELEQMAADFGLGERVEFTGWKPDAAETLLPTFDVFVQSSHWEAMSVVILEAMAAQRPIVATTVGENASVLTPERSAILVPPRNAEALAVGLARVIEDPSLRARLAESAYAAYVDRFTGRAMADRYATAYRECLAGRGLSVPGGQVRSQAGSR